MKRWGNARAAELTVRSFATSASSATTVAVADGFCRKIEAKKLFTIKENI
ncbi:MAG: hypothetical protein AABX51_05030 [Nanoarchaeota archaeon]